MRHALHARFLRGLELSPHGLAVKSGRESVTYAGAHRRALAWAGAIDRAVPRESRVVGVLGTGGVHTCVGVLAALYAGATVVPLHPDFPAARTAHMAEAAGVRLLLTDGAAGPGAGPVPVFDLDDEPPGAPLPAPLPVAPSDHAYILFTSGSTGRPKGVPLTHAGLGHYFRLVDERYDFTPDDVFSGTFDLNFDCSVFDLFCAWGAGAHLVRTPPYAYRDLPRHLAEEQVTVWFSTPSAIGLARRTTGLAEGCLPTLRWSFFAGEALRCEDAAYWQRAAAGSALENLYGPTELTITIARHRWDPATSPELAVNGVVPIGLVHDGHEHLAVDGELWVSGPQMAAGYLDPTDDEGRYVRRDGVTYYRTGDQVSPAPDGQLRYLGRRDNQLQIQGRRVEPAEIEHALRACPGVEDAVAVGVPSGAGTELFVFYTGDRVPPGKLAKNVAESVPAALVPRHYRHVAELPLNGNRKTDRRALLAEAEKELRAPGIPD
ncbi:MULTISPECIES: AMP-binding protein [Streptomyces]|nr:AMP-binding protein [Streptomyces ardesiacus]MCL7365468.1 AMP-binding protein [Streptomyces ardesiacus]